MSPLGFIVLLINKLDRLERGTVFCRMKRTSPRRTLARFVQQQTLRVYLLKSRKILALTAEGCADDPRNRGLGLAGGVSIHMETVVGKLFQCPQSSATGIRTPVKWLRTTRPNP